MLRFATMIDRAGQYLSVFTEVSPTIPIIELGAKTKITLSVGASNNHVGYNEIPRHHVPTM